MSHDEQTIDYFDLIVEIGKKVMSEVPDHLTPRGYLRQRLARSWSQVDSYLSTPLAQLAIHGNEGAQGRIRELLGSLAREALIAAWYMGVQAEDGEDNPERVATQLTKDVVKAKVRL